MLRLGFKVASRNTTSLVQISRLASTQTLLLKEKVSEKQTSQRLNPWSLVTIGILGFAASQPLLCEEKNKEEEEVKNTRTAFEKFKEEKTGNYENRIRAYSHPFKVFQYFASITKNGERFMTPLDFIQSILPYQPTSEGVNAAEVKKRLKSKCQSATNFFKLADTNGDGLISYEEYIFFLSLLATPENYFQIAFKMFDLDESGFIDVEEFQKIILEISDRGVGSRQGKRQRNIVAKELKYGLLEHLFGSQGKTQIDFSDFQTFLVGLHLEVLKLEFISFGSDNNDTLSLQDFARSIIAYSDYRHISNFTKQIEKLPPSNRRITFKEFQAFNKVIEHIDRIGYAMSIYSHTSQESLNKSDLQRAIKASSGILLDNEIIDLLFFIFDSNGDGQLDASEFVDVLKAKQLRGLDQARDLGFEAMLNRVKTCAKILFN